MVTYENINEYYRNAAAYYGEINKKGQTHGKGTMTDFEGEIIKNALFKNGIFAKLDTVLEANLEYEPEGIVL